VFNATRELGGEDPIKAPRHLTNPMLEKFLEGKELHGVAWSKKRSTEIGAGGRKTHPGDKVRDELIHDARLATRCLLSRLQRISRAQFSKLLFANRLDALSATSMQLIRYRPKLSIHA
jgi:hypothetical protein